MSFLTYLATDQPQPEREWSRKEDDFGLCPLKAADGMVTELPYAASVASVDGWRSAAADSHQNGDGGRTDSGTDLGLAGMQCVGGLL